MEQPSTAMGPPGANTPLERELHPLGVTSYNQITNPGARLGDHRMDVDPNNNYTIEPCRSEKCLTCAIFVTDKTYKSNVTNKSYPVINQSNENLHCKSQNLVYLVSCVHCNIQYVGETTTPLHLRMNTHRTSGAGCQFMVNHFKGGCPGNASDFNVQIIVKFPGNGYSQSTVDTEAKLTRLDMEDQKIKILRTVYPYGLNSRIKNKNKNKNTDSIIGTLFPNIPRIGMRPTRTGRKKNTNQKNMNPEEFFIDLNNYMNNNMKDGFNKIRININNMKKKDVKEVARMILNKSDDMYEFVKYSQWYDFILDSIDTKLFKLKNIKDSEKKKSTPSNICVIDYVNKGIDEFNIQRVMKDKDVIECMPAILKDRIDIPVISFRLGPTIRNKIFNYKETIEDLTWEGETTECDCENSLFSDKKLGHIITGDLRIVENSKLRNLMCKGPNFREKNKINYKKCEEAIKKSIIECAIKMARKYKISPDDFENWKIKLFQIIENKTKKLKKQKYHPQANKILNNEEVKTYLSEMKKKFVLVPIDKASNNIAIVCKKYYIERVLDEVGIIGEPSMTYEESNRDKEEIIYNNKKICETLNIEMDALHHTLPIMYWMPKLHKDPIGARFIIASKYSCNKPLSKVLALVYQMIFGQVESFHNKSKFYTGFNLFWVVQNSKPIIDMLDKINKKKAAKSISTFDFSTLYTKITHEDLINKLNEIIDLAFKGGNNKYIQVNNNKAWWTNNKNSKINKNTYFTLNILKKTTEHLIRESFFKIGKKIFLQRIGIPMGINPAPFWANLYLHKYELNYIKGKIKKDKKQAYLFNNNKRFIDDMICINDMGEFEKEFKNIYPESLVLNCEHSGMEATFLDLHIEIEQNTFSYKLFDKRDSYAFKIVRMPYISSNIPNRIFYATFTSELLRIARTSSKEKDFTDKSNLLIRRMRAQGGNDDIILKYLKRMLHRHDSCFKKYNKLHKDLISDLLNVPKEQQ